MNKLATPTGTLEILHKYGLNPQKHLGQNFLVDANILAKIIGAAEINPDDVVVEIGPGIGTLTRKLAEKAKQVIAVELDRSLLPVLRETLADLSNVRVIHGNALRTDFDSLVFAETSEKTYKVVANLPYYITTPIIAYFLERFAGAVLLVLLVQWEVAARLVALPDNKDYGAISLLVQYYSQSEVVARVPPGVFWPRPAVSSALIRLRKRRQPAVALLDEKMFFAIVRAAFNRRRKILPNALEQLDLNMTKEKLVELIQSAGVNPNRRGESLSLAEFAVIANTIIHKKK